MKKRSLTIILFFCICGISEAQIEAGGGLFIVTDDVFDLGVDLRGTYQFSENWRGALSIGLFFPDKEEVSFTLLGVTNTTAIKSSAFSISAEANYFFTNLDSKIVNLYGLFGLNFITVSVDFEDDFTGIAASGSDSGLSFNFGAGADFNAGKALKPFGEIKYSAGDANYASIVAGLKFPIN